MLYFVQRTFIYFTMSIEITSPDKLDAPPNPLDVFCKKHNLVNPFSEINRLPDQDAPQVDFSHPKSEIPFGQDYFVAHFPTKFPVKGRGWKEGVMTLLFKKHGTPQRILFLVNATDDNRNKDQQSYSLEEKIKTVIEITDLNWLSNQ